MIPSLRTIGYERKTYLTPAHIYTEQILGTSNMTDDLTQRELIEDFANKSNY